MLDRGPPGPQPGADAWAAGRAKINKSSSEGLATALERERLVGVTRVFRRALADRGRLRRERPTAAGVGAVP
jgi:hypothetical protein